MPELVTPGPRWATSFRAALAEAAACDEAVPWDPAADCTESALSIAIEAMAAGVWGPGALHSTQRMRWWVEGDAYLARISLRHRTLRDSDPARYLEHGDIGYDVRPSERGRGRATTMLQTMLELARQLDYPDVMITCDESNIASRRVIEKAGGVFMDRVDRDEPLLRYRCGW